MITLDLVCARFTRLDPADLRRWVAEGWVRPDLAPEGLVFQEIDVERVGLILDLRDDLAVEEESLPLVLSLLDQVYALRRRLRQAGVPPEDS